MVVYDKVKGGVNRQVSVHKLSESEPLMTCRNYYFQSKLLASCGG